MPYSRPPEFDALIVRHMAFIKRLAFRLIAPRDADDMAQETMERCLANWRLYRPGASAAPWIKYQMLQLRTARARKARTERKYMIAGAYDAAVAPRADEATDARRIVAAAVAGPDGAVLARLAMGDTLTEAGAPWGYSKQLTHQRAERGRAALRAQFGEAA